MAKVAQIAILFMALTLAFEASAARFGRPIPPEDSVESDDAPSAPSNFRSRIPRFDETGEGSGPDIDDQGSEDISEMPSPPSFNRPSFAGGGAGGFGGESTSAGFGNADAPVQFKLVAPDSKPTNPRAASYERYKKYRR